MTQYFCLGKLGLRLLALSAVILACLGLLASAVTQSAYAEGGGGSAQAAPGVEEMGLLSARWNQAKQQVVLDWNSVNESQIVGYNVMKKGRLEGWYKVNTRFIQAKNPGMFFGAKYKYRDSAVTPGKTVKYRIEMVYANGSARVSGVSKVKIPAQ